MVLLFFFWRSYIHCHCSFNSSKLILLLKNELNSFHIDLLFNFTIKSYWTYLYRPNELNTFKRLWNVLLLLAVVPNEHLANHLALVKQQLKMIFSSRWLPKYGHIILFHSKNASSVLFSLGFQAIVQRQQPLWHPSLKMRDYCSQHFVDHGSGQPLDMLIETAKLIQKVRSFHNSYNCYAAEWLNENKNWQDLWKWQRYF